MRTTVSISSQRITKQSQTRDQVFDLIENVGVGHAIPSERQLSQDFGVSRLTVRAAIDELAREGYLVRRRGSGTFVSEPKIAQELTMSSFSEEMRKRGMRPASKTLSLEVKHAGAYLGRCLHVSPSERIVVATRLRLADDETMAIETLHVPEPLVPGLTRQDFDETSFYDLLDQPLRNRDRRRHPDDRADGDQRGGVRDPRRSASFSRFPVRAHDAVRVGDYRRVRAFDLPRRSLPARHRAEPSRAAGCCARLPAPEAVAVSAAAASNAPAVPGAKLLAEIREQPAALRRLLEHADEYAAVAEEATRRGLDLVRMVGHGSSDNAASYGVYAFGLLPAWTAMRDSISLSVYYGAKVDLRGSLVLGLSQSGQTPDVLEYVERARARGAFTIGVTNEPDSSLASAADFVLPLAAGPEHAIAATKTYTEPDCRTCAPRGLRRRAWPRARGRHPPHGGPPR